MALKIFEKFSPRANPADTDYPYGSIKNESVPGAKDGTPLDASWGNDMLGFTDALLDEAGITPNGLPDTVGLSQRLDALKTVVRKPLELKIFQSPTDNLTKISTFAGGVGVVYEVRKTSDNNLVTIYSDKDGVTSIPQNGTANVSNGDAEVVFYIDDGDYTVSIGGASAETKVIKKTKEYNSVADMVSGNPNEPVVGDLCIVQDYYGDVSPNNSGLLFFRCVTDNTGTANGGKYIQGDGVQFEQNLKTPYCIRAWGARADNATDTKPAWDALTLYIRQNFAGAEIRFEGNYYFSDTPIFYSAFVYQGGGKGVTSINLPAGKNGVKINPAPTNSVSYLEMRDFTIQASNTFPSAPKETGLKIDLTAACRRLNIRDVDIKGFTNGVDGKCPFYTCTFKNMDIQGIVPRDINDIQNYTNDNSFGFASGFNDNVGDVRDATTVTMENVFTGSFGTGIHNRYTSAMQLINCVSERNFYGVLADKGVFGTMYQEWNKESVKARGLHEPSGVNITAINSPGSWGTVTADTISTARASKFRTLSPTRGYQEYSDVTPVVISTSTTYLDFNELNGEAITATSAPIHRILGLYEIEVSFSQNNDPTVQGTYIFDIWVKEDGEPTYRNVKRSFLRVDSTDDFLGTLQFNYKGVTRGNQSNFRVSVSRVDGEAFTLSAGSLTTIIREI